MLWGQKLASLTVPLSWILPLLHERQACCLDYATGTNGEGRRNRAFDLMHVTHLLC